MARSVSTHPNAVAIFYCNPEIDTDPYFWEPTVDNIKEALQNKYKSLASANRWEGRENNIILESEVAEISISEYNGIIAICLAPVDPNNALHYGWCGRAAKGFKEVLTEVFPDSRLESRGRASNGEQFFSRPGRAVTESCITSKEGTLW